MDKVGLEKKIETTPAEVTPLYICGECGHESEINTKDQIRCKHCGYRVLYKKRNRHLKVFSAR